MISETAIIVASLRALSNYENNSMLKCGDHFAELFLPEERIKPLLDAGSRELIRKSIPGGMYEYVISRTRYFDQILLDSLQLNFNQVVFLGAGFDSRPYRFSQSLKDSLIFEIDNHVTQDYKKSILSKNLVPNENIIYVSTNFEEGDLFSKLIQHGFDPYKKALFLWEGVTFYLSKEAVTNVLGDIRMNSAPGSRICFDFQTMKNENDLIRTGLKDESIKFGIPDGKIEEYVAVNGYKIIEYLDSRSIEARFLTDKNEQSLGEISPIMNFLLIEH